MRERARSRSRLRNRRRKTDQQRETKPNPTGKTEEEHGAAEQARATAERQCDLPEVGQVGRIPVSCICRGVACPRPLEKPGADEPRPYETRRVGKKLRCARAGVWPALPWPTQAREKRKRKRAGQRPARRSLTELYFGFSFSPQQTSGAVQTGRPTRARGARRSSQHRGRFRQPRRWSRSNERCRSRLPWSPLKRSRD